MASRSGIPLHCNICVKKPDFSDVSHLLTHIASKGHLSTYYQIKVKAGSEDASRHLIEQYDTWYARWSIEDLMSDRLNLKEKRKTKGRSGANASPPGSLHTTYPDPPVYSHLIGPGAYDSMMDPQLVAHIKSEPLSPTTTHAHAQYLDAMPMFGMHPNYTHTGPLWRMPQYQYMSTKQDVEAGEPNETPIRPNRGQGKRRHPYATIVQGEGDIGDYNETSKLKGVFWPGMDMFDAASPEQRRKRNQKKDTSVVKQLEATSRVIEAMELIFTPLGVQCASRVISGLPESDDNLLPGEQLAMRPKKPKQLAARKPLAERSANASRKTAGKSQKRGRPVKATGAAGKKLEQQLNGGAVVNTQQKKRKKVANIGHDEEDEAIQHLPAEMDLLTSGFHPPEDHHRDLRASAPATYRPTEPMYVHHYAPYAYHAGYQLPSNYELIEQANFPTSWDSWVSDNASIFINPLAFGMEDEGDEALDDQETLSARSQDSEQ